MGVRRPWPGLLLAAILLAGTGGPASAKEPAAHPAPVPLIDFRIKDQLDVLHTSGYYRDSVVVLISGDRLGSTFMDEWFPVFVDSLTAEIARYRVKFIPHAHLKGAPFFLHGTIKGKFSEDPSEWVLMDWDGEFKEAYDLAEDQCSIVVFDDQGIRRIQLAVREFEPAVFQRTLDEIRSLIE